MDAVILDRYGLERAPEEVRAAMAAIGEDDPEAHDSLGNGPEAIAGLVHSQINYFRTETGLPPLRYSRDLEQVAVQHSHDMMVGGFVAHRNQRGESPMDRAKRAGFQCRAEWAGRYRNGFSENIWRGSGFYHREPRGESWLPPSSAIPASAVDDWMNNPGHRANILKGGFSRHGVGVVVDRDGDRVYITQNFC